MSACANQQVARVLKLWQHLSGKDLPLVDRSHTHTTMISFTKNDLVRLAFPPPQLSLLWWMLVSVLTFDDHLCQGSMKLKTIYLSVYLVAYIT